jgi:hypothetical protein
MKNRTIEHGRKVKVSKKKCIGFGKFLSEMIVKFATDVLCVHQML